MLFRSDRKSTRLNSSHTIISYAVFCLKKKKKKNTAEAADAKDKSVTTRASVARQPLLRLVSYAVAQLSFLVLYILSCFFFFFNEPAPPEFSPFPLPAPFPI